METQVPRIIMTACSMVFAFKSSILISAMERKSSSVTEPTFSRFGSPDPLGTLAAFKINLAAGGVFVINVKVLFTNLVI